MPGAKLAIVVAVAIALSLPQRAESTPKTAPTTPTAAPRETDPDVTFVLRAMNTSRERPSIDIEVAIDGVVAVRDRLSSEEQRKGFSIAPSKTFPLRIPAGKHRLHAVSSEASVSLDREFEIKKKHWALLSYEAGPDKTYRFAWTFQDKPIYFQ